MRLINAIVQSGLTQLIDLNLDGNASWFRHSEVKSYLLDFIKEQTCLKHLWLSYNKFSCTTTKEILSVLLESNNIKTI